VLVGINLLREGLDLPEVGLVAILDADKEGFLRSTTSLIQTIGRAARNVDGRVILYADVMTDSMRNAIDETNRRRTIQMAYNEANGITPQTIRKAINDVIEISKPVTQKRNKGKSKSKQEDMIQVLQAEMQAAAEQLDFERAAILRDRLFELMQDQDKIIKIK